MEIKERIAIVKVNGEIIPKYWGCEKIFSVFFHNPFFIKWGILVKRDLCQKIFIRGFRDNFFQLFEISMNIFRSDKEDLDFVVIYSPNFSQSLTDLIIGSQLSISNFSVAGGFA